MQEDKITEVREVNTTDNGTVQRDTVRRRSSVSGAIVAQRLVWFVVGVIVAFLALRVLLLLLAANQGSAFVDFVYSVGGFFAVPFFGIFSYTPAYGQSVFEISSLVAIAIYVLVGWGVAKLLTLSKPQSEV